MSQIWLDLSHVDREEETDNFIGGLPKETFKFLLKISNLHISISGQKKLLPVLLVVFATNCEKCVSQVEEGISLSLWGTRQKINVTGKSRIKPQ